MTKLAEIQSAILQLDPAEREELRHWLDETAEETPEMLAAIDEGLRSLKEKGVIPLEDVRRELKSWGRSQRPGDAAGAVAARRRARNSFLPSVNRPRSLPERRLQRAMR